LITTYENDIKIWQWYDNEDARIVIISKNIERSLKETNFMEEDSIKEQDLGRF
jgi:hypothetical protein